MPLLLSQPRAALALCAAFLAACASTPAPREELAVARAAVDQAQASGASELAPLDLTAARQKLERANAALQAGDHLIARRLAEQAQADAQLAAARADAEKSRRAVAEVEASIRALRDELSRTAPPIAR